ncbi:uncharacterized protein PAC_15440 [Phialocephala subalpina]|uniref:Uncharacterized protein n=1 Tax=Phialocephala subalpina TaxID=576137 RepID=A0A1L7XKF7_9HELO|nr:uncharacterized protein PAC_15440 [Phialocephala subalpina]
MSESRRSSTVSCSSSVSEGTTCHEVHGQQSPRAIISIGLSRNNGSNISSSTLPPTSRWSLIEEDTASTAINNPQDASDEHGSKVQYQLTVDALTLDNSKSVEEGHPATESNLQKVSVKRALLDNWMKVIPHIISIVVTAAVVQLSFRNVYWMDLKAPNKDITPGLTQGGALNFLQLAAKLHELLILASISSIVLHAVQYHLTGSSGLPLGMVSNSFELTSGQFLRRKSFWTLLLTVDPNSGKRFLYMRFWILSLFAAILVVLSGPSSAIAVLPTLNYFAVDKPFNSPVLPYFIFNKSTELWPVTLTEGSLNSPIANITCQNPLSYSETQACPASGYRENYSWGGSTLLSNTDLGSNIMYTGDVGSTRRVVTTKSCNSTTFDGRASAVGLTAFISNAFTAYWQFAQDNFAGVALDANRPHISPESKCFTAMFFPTWSNTSQFPVPDWTFRYERPLNASNFTLFSIPSNGPETPSLGAVITIPLIQGAQQRSNHSNITWYQTTQNFACSEYAQWVPVDAWYEPRTDDQVEFIPEDGIANVSQDDLTRSRAKFLSTILAGMVTDGMARIAGNGAFPYSAPMFLVPNRTADGILEGKLLITSAVYGEIEVLNTTNIEDVND